jgi:hypothetical protein
VRFQVLAATSMKMTVFWDAALRSLVDTDRRFRGVTAAAIAPMMEAVSTSESLASFCQITQRNIPEDSRRQGDEPPCLTCNRSPFCVFVPVICWAPVDLLCPREMVNQGSPRQ